MRFVLFQIAVWGKDILSMTWSLFRTGFTYIVVVVGYGVCDRKRKTEKENKKARQRQVLTHQAQRDNNQNS